MGNRNGRKELLMWVGLVAVMVVVIVLGVWMKDSTFKASVYLGEVDGQSLAELPAGFKLAITGDQGINANSVKVMELIRDEGADMAIVSGDFGYNESDPNTSTVWDQMITNILGVGYPLFASRGNHDVSQWDKYQSFLEERVNRIPEANCVGDLGVRSACNYKGLFFTLTDEGVDDAFYQEQLAQSQSLWKVCSWHKNRRVMQVGGKADDVSWGAYEECRKGGAFIVSAHEHSYSRTKTLSDMSRQTVDSLWSDPNALRVGAGSSFVAVSGLGGYSIRPQNRCLPADYPYGCNEEWASIYTSNQGAKYGVLFIEFNIDGDPRKARGYFKNVDGEVIDTFTLMADVDGDSAPVAK